MKRLFHLFLRSFSAKMIFLAMGLASTLWFLIRVIPKPSRAAYPCMQAAAPVMSGFVLYLLSIGSSVFLFRKFTRKLLRKEFHLAFALLAVGLVFYFWAEASYSQKAKALNLVGVDYFTPNDPVGVPKGLHPGRVVWVWSPDATNENCSNEEGDYWYQNTDQDVVNDMMTLGILNYAGENDPESSWDAIFRHFNSNHGKGNIGYASGEKIYIKINLTNTYNLSSGTNKVDFLDQVDATPEVVLSLLNQLINVVGVAEEDIYLGDPFRTFHDILWDFCHSKYPDVNYCDGRGENGRHKTVATSEDIMKFSDGLYDWRIPQEYVDAAYLINLSNLKTHESGGITLAAKNHQGSVLQDGAGTGSQSAYDMHYSLPDHDDTDGGNHRYRHLVDYMGHEHVGGKTLIAIVDGLWAGKNWQGYIEKWQMSPFNNDYPNSIFFSQDPVAIESVGFDFLLTEYADKPDAEKYPYMAGTGDYILQAADPDSRPEGVSYDPEDDGTDLGSLGVYEHWNNAEDKEYTEIDFVKVILEPGSGPDLNIMLQEEPLNVSVYPNPASNMIFLEYSLDQPAEVIVRLMGTDGKLLQVQDLGSLSTGSHKYTMQLNTFPEGSYLLCLDITENGKSASLEKIIQVKH
ncbi:MAG: DUF362 domain-containing protein [Bacteroidales bacterium]|nr:DUF362 domain-containing protein [Bacteroidales bacterium]